MTWNAVKVCGINNCFTATFDALPSVEDQWIEELSILANLLSKLLLFGALRLC